MFEAVHGSAPMIAGQGIANPSGLLQGAVLMLVHLGKTKVAEQIQNAWLSTIESRYSYGRYLYRRAEPTKGRHR
jgi:Isocitrate/isopropylmalate dehydrogenase